MAYTLRFFAEKMWVAFAKCYSHFFSKNTFELDIVLTRTVNILTTKELIMLTMLWTTGPSKSLTDFRKGWIFSLWLICWHLHNDKNHKNKIHSCNDFMCIHVFHCCCISKLHINVYCAIVTIKIPDNWPYCSNFFFFFFLHIPFYSEQTFLTPFVWDLFSI